MQILTYINQFKAGKDGRPYTSKTGKPFVRVSVKTQEYKDEYVSGLWFGPDCPWKVGESVDMIITKEIYNGKEQLKFELPKKDAPNQKNHEEVMGKLTRFNLLLEELVAWKRHETGEDRAKITGTEIDYPESDIDPNDVPF